MKDQDTIYRLGILLAATEQAIADSPTIERCREAHSFRRQMQEA